MMRKVFSVSLMATLACVFGLAQSAIAGITVDIAFRDSTSPTGITISPAGEPGPGCAFGGYAGGSAPSGRCMDVIVTTTWPLIGFSIPVHYDTDNGLAVASFYEWVGIGVVFNKGNPTKFCAPFDGITDKGDEVSLFDCVVPPPNLTTPMPVGTYNIGTIVWDTSGTTVGTETISIVNALSGAVINGAIYDISSLIVMGSHILTIVPEPGTASLLGLGMIGLILAGRRSRA